MLEEVRIAEMELSLTHVGTQDLSVVCPELSVIGQQIFCSDNHLSFSICTLLGESFILAFYFYSLNLYTNLFFFQNMPLSFFFYICFFLKQFMLK